MASSSLKSVNPNAEIMSKEAALFMNLNAAKGLQGVMKSNLGPKGTIKMLVGGAGGTRRARLARDPGRVRRVELGTRPRPAHRARRTPRSARSGVGGSSRRLKKDRQDGSSVDLFSSTSPRARD